MIRFAPTANGPLHLGHYRTYVAGWLISRHLGVPYLVDIDVCNGPGWRPTRPVAVDVIVQQLGLFGLLPDRIDLPKTSVFRNWPYPDLEESHGGLTVAQKAILSAIDKGVGVLVRGTDLRDADEQLRLWYAERYGGVPPWTTYWVGVVTFNGLKLSTSMAEWMRPEKLIARYGTNRLFRVCAESLFTEPLDWMAATPEEIARHVHLPLSERDVDYEDLLRRL